MSLGPGRPKRSLGQNFLVDRNVAAKIVGRLAIAPGDTVIEIGPGRGALCPHVLAASPGRYLCVELDYELARRIPLEFPGARVINADALRFNWDRTAGALILGNLPYNVASPLIWDIARSGRYVRAVFMIQREVASRLCCAPGSKTYGGLSAFVQAFAETAYQFTVPPGVFRPRPKVDSAVVSLIPRPNRPDAAEAARLAGLIRGLFAKRRKQLHTILRDVWSESLEEAVASLGLTPQSRPEEVGPQGFRTLLKNMPRADFPLTFP